MKRSSPLLCGPLLRYVDRTTAVIWVEMDQEYEIEVCLTPLNGPAGGAALSCRGWTVRVGASHYAWIACEWLLPETWYLYEIIGHRPDGATLHLWPDHRLTRLSLPSTFRTPPLWSLDTLRLAYGSCRAGYAQVDPNSLEKGPDALHGLAVRLSSQWDTREATWPHLLLFIGDQIYADDLSQSMLNKFRRPPLRAAVSDAATTLPQFAEVYREAWTATPNVRWLLSCIPSFMIFDDHEQLDDWNITEGWVQQHRSPEWIDRLSAGLLAYWIYQGAGNLSPRRWLLDERARLLSPRVPPVMRDITLPMQELFRSYIQGTRRASWGYAIDVAGTRIVLADSRMSRKLTGHRLLMDSADWEEFVHLAKDHPYRRVILIVPGPMLLPHPLHDLYSWVAEMVEHDATLSERLSTATVGAVAGAAGGAIVGGAGGFLLGGPPGLAAGAAGGAVVGGAAGFIAGYSLDELVGGIVNDAIIDKDIELWPAFPTSFNRMVTLLEDLADGRGTTRKSFIGMIAGDVHFSYVMEGDLLKTQRRTPVLHLTMSPFKQQIAADRAAAAKRVMSGDHSDFPVYLQIAINAGLIYRPEFVEAQMRRLDWFPINRSGGRGDASKADDWSFFGNFIGWLELQGAHVTYWYDQAETGGSVGVQLTDKPITQASAIRF
jgi:PhoD-like phosphatase